MGTISNIYLLIFIPLIASLCCQVIYGKKTPFYLAALTSFVILFLTLRILPDILFHEKIANDFRLSILSLALEFKIDLLCVSFLLPLVIVKIIILFFFRRNIENSLSDEGIRNFYSVFLLHLFALSGIFTSNNIFNLFFFFEIYAFSFFAISSIARDIKLLKISFNYFCLSAAASLIIIFCFFVIYLTFDEVNFDKIINLINLSKPNQYWFVKSIFWLLALAFLLKFFPLWIFFQKLKSSNLVAGFMVIDSLFVKSLVGIFLVIKFCYFLFGADLIFTKFHFDVALLALAAFLIFYSAFKLYKQKHLKLICAYLSLNNIGFIIAAIALQSPESLQSVPFYLLNFCFVNLFIFLLAIFLKRNFKTSSIHKIYLTRNSNLVLPLSFLVLFVLAFPITFLFFANWHLALATMHYDFGVIIFIGLIASNFIYSLIGFKFIKGLFFARSAEFDSEEIISENHKFYLIFFWLLTILILAAILFSNLINNFAIILSSYLLSNTI